MMEGFNIGKLRIPMPIVQGGMGIGVSLSGLAAAVANEGGVGVISCAGLGVLYSKIKKDYVQACIEGLKTEISKARAKTKGVIGVNIMCVLTNFEDMVRVSIEEKIDVIFSGAGLPLDLPKYLKEDSVTKLVPIVSSARAAKLICQKWKSIYNYLPDAIVLEGPKAGGHLGFKAKELEDERFSLEELTPQVLKEIKVFEEEYNQKIPLIVGGGIYTGADIYNFLKLGATGVQMGSRFVTTDECDASQVFKQTYLDATITDMEIIQSPVGMPGRAIKNAFLDKVKEGLKKPVVCPYHCLRTCEMEKTPYCIVAALYNAYRGNMNSGYAFAGSNAYLATKITSVKQTFLDLKEEYQNKLDSLSVVSV
ncbi:2-nitropropane dioxygenase [Bacteroidales bacterium]|nr:2-nitropropane dioxygenase [Bacteroidales bacterium]